MRMDTRVQLCTILIKTEAQNLMSMDTRVQLCTILIVARNARECKAA